MTCIAGLVEDGQVYLAGDSGEFTGWNVIVVPEGKIYRKGPCLLGSAGYARFRDVVKHQLVLPGLEGYDTVEQWAVLGLVPSLRECLREHGQLKQESGQESHENTLLIGVAGQLIRVSQDFAVTQHHEMAAIGCGAEYALGSLWSTVLLDPRARLQLALESAAAFSAGVRRPFTFLNTLEDSA
jgi:hypothetical protein